MSTDTDTLTTQELIRSLRADLERVRAYHVEMVRVFSGSPRTSSVAVRTRLIPLGHLIQVLETKMDAHAMNTETTTESTP